MTDAESVNKLFLGSLRRVFRNVVQGFSLVRHGPEGSHYKIWRWKIPAIANTNLSLKPEQNQTTYYKMEGVYSGRGERI